MNARQQQPESRHIRNVPIIYTGCNQSNYLQHFRYEDNDDDDDECINEGIFPFKYHRFPAVCFDKDTGFATRHGIVQFINKSVCVCVLI